MPPLSSDSCDPGPEDGEKKQAISMSFTRTGRKLSDSHRPNYRMRRGKSLRPTTFSMKRLKWSSSTTASVGTERRGNRPLLTKEDRKCGECTVSSTHIRLHLNGNKDGVVASDIATPLQPLNMWFKGSSCTNIVNKKKKGLLGLLSHGGSVCQATICSHVAFSTAASGSTDGCVLTG